MKLWFSPSSEVPIYRQMVTQVSLAILAGDLQPGDRLPSTRELARRFSLHPNTISAGYRLLEKEGWTERRHGSGVYVRSDAQRPQTPEQVLEHHIAGFFRAVRELDLPSAAIRARVAEWLASPPPDQFILVEPDEELRNILIAEMRSFTDVPITGMTLAQTQSADAVTAAIAICRPTQEKAVRAALPAGVELITLQIQSANTWLAHWMPNSNGQLLAVVSRWPEFLSTAKTMLIAAGLHPDSLLFRDARKPRWNAGLDEAFAVLTDTYTASLAVFPRKPQKILYQVIAEAAREDLRRRAATLR
jgi:DNA-binding transcriptional regulator YhcF (GntR family)